ncbi:hypothetical protein PybrP1_007761 [[Pythium] brassicae (nom. inval.)]|nr:hypothetical protein PybrP1_007761 [[Pythium] brassicae (nom. inval.)]
MHVRFPLASAAVVAVAVGVLIAAPAPTAAAVHVHDAVHRTLQELGRVSIVLTLKEPRPDDLLSSIPAGSGGGENREAASSPSPSPTMLKKHSKKSSKKSCTDHSDDDGAERAGDDGEHVQALVDRLVQYSQEKQQEVLAVIKEDAANTSTPTSGAAKSLWITNEVYVRDATPELIEKLKELPTLGSIREEVVAKLSIRASAAAAMDENDFVGEWGVDRIQAVEAWKLGYLGRNGEIKPDLTAPGETVVAPSADGDGSIFVYSGTSFAAPHVAGAIALLLEAAPGLTTSQVKDLLTRTADTSPLSTTNQPTCGTLSAASAFPNNAFGYGRLNILRAINAQRAAAAIPAPTSAAPIPAPVNGSSSSSSVSATVSSALVVNSSSFDPGTVNVGDL